MSSMAAQSLLEKTLAETIGEDRTKALDDALKYFGLTRDNMHEINSRYKRMMKILHPDAGGTTEAAQLAKNHYDIVASAQPFRPATEADYQNIE